MAQALGYNLSAMPARIRLVNWRWVRWSGGEWGAGEPQLMRGTVEAILDRIGGKWRIPDAPELEEEFFMPTYPLDHACEIAGKPSVVAFNEQLKRELPYEAPYNPEQRIELVELFEEPEWTPDTSYMVGEDGTPARY